MEFGNLGNHCSDPTCRQKDFLPFTCKFCENKYCLEHRATSSHDCPKANMGDHQVVICPICLKTLTFDAGKMTQEQYWSIHHATDCDPTNYAKVKAERSRMCKGKGCKTKLTTLNTYKCKSCNQDLCLKHRYEDQHVCSKADSSRNIKSIGESVFNAFGNMFKPTVQPTTCAAQYAQELCDVCGKGFHNLNDLISHAQKAHY